MISSSDFHYICLVLQTAANYIDFFKSSVNEAWTVVEIAIRCELNATPCCMNEMLYHAAWRVLNITHPVKFLLTTPSI